MTETTTVPAGGPTCAGCGGRATLGRHGLGIFCSECWASVPNARRKDVSAAAQTLGMVPTSRNARDAFDQAVAAAAEHVA